MLGLPPSVSVAKDDHMTTYDPGGPLNPPIITHTAATPVPTPQGSPNETLGNTNTKNNLAVANAFSLSVEDKRPVNNVNIFICGCNGV